MLSYDPAIEVVGEAGNGEQALELVSQLEPDVVLIDIRMPGMNGIEATQRIKEARPATAVVILTMYDSPMYVLEALRIGASGYLVKSLSRELLCHAVNAAAEGGTTVGSGLLRDAPRRLMPVPRQADDIVVPLRAAVERFTVRELEVLNLVAQGFANKEIASRLNLAEVTVKKYVQSIMAKLGATDRTHAAILAVRLGLVE